MSEKIPEKEFDTEKHEYEDENQFRELLKFLNEYFELEQKWENLQSFATDHPIASLFLIVTVGMSSVPLVFFGLFVIGSLTMTFLGFLVVEGFALAFGTLMLGGSLFFVGLFSIGFSIFLLLGYFSLKKFADIYVRLKQMFLTLPAGESENTSVLTAK